MRVLELLKMDKEPFSKTISALSRPLPTSHHLEIIQELIGLCCQNRNHLHYKHSPLTHVLDEPLLQAITDYLLTQQPQHNKLICRHFMAHILSHSSCYISYSVLHSLLEKGLKKGREKGLEKEREVTIGIEEITMGELVEVGGRLCKNWRHQEGRMLLSLQVPLSQVFDPVHT